MSVDYSSVTETPDIKVSEEQVARLYQRYKFARRFCENKNVLEIACGAGQGLGYMAEVANRVVGGDIEEKNLRFARETFKGNKKIEVQILDAHNLPFPDKIFDTVILYEAIYYLSDPQKFLKESKRVLTKDGTLLLCTVNKEWEDFNPSPYSTTYFSAAELQNILSTEFTGIEFYGGFPVDNETSKDKLVSIVKRTAVAFHLIPKTMKGKQVLKRIFFGKLVPLPHEVKEGMTEYIEPAPVSPENKVSNYKVLYIAAKTQ
jgi:ubiquinone/menaquinone biosynthesis C-methylase UbiE